MSTLHLLQESELDRVLLHIKGLVYVRALLEDQGASPTEIAEHTAELERERERLAQLVRLSANGQVEREQGPAAVGASGRNGAAMGFGDLTDDRESESRARESAGPRSPVKTVEDVRQIRRIDSRPLVSNADAPLFDRDLDLGAL